MKAVALDPLGRKTPGDGQSLGDPRHVTMKFRIETSYLWQTRHPLIDQFNHIDLGRQMLRRIGADTAQFPKNFLRDLMRFTIPGATVYDAVAYCRNRRKTDLLGKPVEQEICRRTMIELTDAAITLLLPGGVIESEMGSLQADAVDLAAQSLPGLVAVHPVHRELDARGAPVDREDARAG